MMPVDYGQFVFPGFCGASGLMCRWCDQVPGMSIIMESQAMWTELEMLERGSWPRRIQDLIDNHAWHPNCRCTMFPQAEDPENPG